MATDRDHRRVPDGCDDRCQDPKMHAFYVNGGNFHWRRPKIDLIHSVERRVRVGLNRYPHNVIGAYVSFRGRGVGVRWKGSR